MLLHLNYPSIIVPYWMAGPDFTLSGGKLRNGSGAGGNMGHMSWTMLSSASWEAILLSNPLV